MEVRVVEQYEKFARRLFHAATRRDKAEVIEGA
jgi:hypothetical protein